MQAGRAKVLDKFDLTLGVTSCSRNRHGTQPLCTILETQTTCKHAITRRILEHIALTTANHIEVTGNHIGPRTNVMLGINNYTGVTCSSTGGVDTNSIIQMASYQTIRIVITKILLCGKRNLTQIVQAVDRISRDTQLT